MSFPKSVYVKIFSPHQKRVHHRRFQALPGHEYTADSARAMVERLRAELEANFGKVFEPVSFRVVKIGKGQFNLIPSEQCPASEYQQNVALESTRVPDSV